MKNSFLFILIASLFISCNLNPGTENKKNQNNISFSAATWNLQEFFDANTQGCEYKEYQNTAKWTKEKYYERLERTCSVIKTINADVYFFEEIENEAVLYDISNQLAGNSWNSSKNWNYACFAKEEGSAIGNAIVSKFPLSEVKTHCIDIRTQEKAQPSVRPVLQATLEVKGKTVTLFSCHWKSKSGGEAESEIWRDWQEFSVANQISKISGPFILAGDFNRSAEDFVTDFSGSENQNTIFRGFEIIKIYNPFFLPDGTFSTQSGTYYYKNFWERIDNFFCSSDVEISNFRPETGTWTDENCLPVSYSIYSNKGYSDHLPLVCTVNL